MHLPMHLQPVAFLKARPLNSCTGVYTLMNLCLFIYFSLSTGVKRR